MSNRIELETSYYLGEDDTNILNKIKEENFILSEEVIEEDTYFTDKELEFVKNRICLRTRKIKEDYLELTYKPRTSDETEKYGKKEVNLKIDVKDYEDTKYMLKELGYIEYVSFKKNRKVYSKLIENLQNAIKNLETRVSCLEQNDYTVEQHVESMYQNGYAVGQYVVSMYQNGKLGMGTIIKSTIAWIKYKLSGKR